MSVIASVRPRARLATLLLSATAFGLSAGAAHATDGYFLHGVGAKAKGMAGVAIALPQDALSIAANPAAATEVGHRLDLGVDLFLPVRGASITGNGAGLNGSYSGNGANPFILPDVGYVRPLSDKLAVGIAVYGNGGMNTVYKTNPFASFGATGDAGVDLKQIFITPTVAFKPVPGHSIGVSPVGVVQSFRVNGILPFGTQDFGSVKTSVDPTRFSNLGNSWSFGAGIRVGYLGHFGERLSIGAFYQSKIATGRFKKYAGLYAEQGGFDVPASWGGGVAVKLTDALTLAGDVKRIEYAGVKSVGNPLGQLALGNQFGSSNGPGFGWRNITVYKAGLSYVVNPKLTVRAGYGRSGNPVPSSQTLLNILAPGVVQDHYTLGATWTTPSSLEVTGYALHAPKNHVYGSGSIPGGPGGFGGGEANVYLAETSVGVSFGLKF